MRFSALNVIIIALLTNIFCLVRVKGQDIHFSQHHTTTLVNNPASTGIMDKDFRMTNNYRNQWASIAMPYHTVHISLEKKFYVGEKQIGAGFYVVNDQTFGSNLSVNKFFFSLSYPFFIDNHQIVIGIQPGFILKGVDLSRLTFGSQFDSQAGTYNPQLPSNEASLMEKSNNFDLNSGIMWRTYYRGIMPVAGFAVNHIMQPKESFSIDSLQTRLPLKFIINAAVKIPLLKTYDLTPCALFGTSAGSKEFVLGAIGGYNLPVTSFGISRIYALNYYRAEPVKNFDAMILGGGLVFYNFDICLTYDFNISPLRKATNFKGAFEISLVFTTGKRNIGGAEPCIVY